jgi:hypothetical protein
VGDPLNGSELMWALVWALQASSQRHSADLHGKAPINRRGLSQAQTTTYGLRRICTETVPPTLQTSALPLGYGAEGQQT